MIGLENCFRTNFDVPVLFIWIVILFVLTVALFGVCDNAVYKKVGSWFHHYTDNDSLVKIISSGFIRASTDIINDAIYGKGTYFTKLPPVITPKDVLAENNYNNLAKQKLLEGKLERCLSVFLSDSDVKDVSQNGRNIFLYPGDLFLSGVKCIVT